MLYNIENPIGRAMGGYDSVRGSYASMMKKGPERPGPTTAGAVNSGMG